MEKVKNQVPLYIQNKEKGEQYGRINHSIDFYHYGNLIIYP